LIGTTLAHFRVTAKLGEGGMGEVYRAEDTKLGREVALKLLPEAVARDPERLARFEREAKLLAALDHRNIAAIYGLEEAEGRHVLVMQLAEGETLAERIARGAVAPEEAIAIVMQIASAIEAAHEKGIIHRDLKPANVKVDSEGGVKVLDFGLAKALDLEAHSVSDSGSLSMSPTLTAQMTAVGVILGTASYMSPEQARGQEADERSDIWSFGVVLYEMLTGRKAFRGDTVSDTLASILKEEPDESVLPADTPRAVRRVLERCFVKSPKDRLHSIADARLDLQSAKSGAADIFPEESGSGKHRLAWGKLIAAAVAGALVTFGLLRLLPGRPTQPSEQQQLHLTINPPSELLLAGHAVISRRGDFVVFQGFDGSVTRLYLRRLGDFETAPLAGTDEAARPSISPDGQWVAFIARDKLKKMAVAGGDPLTLCDLQRDSPGFRWELADSIFFTPSWRGSGLQRVSTEGGEPEPLTQLDEAAGELGHWWPQVLPGEKKILFTVWRAGSGLNDADIAVLDLDTGSTRVLFSGAMADYLASGHLLYYHAGNYLVAPFDLETLAMTGPSVVVLPDAARRSPNGGSLILTSVSDNGTLVYLPTLPEKQISWYDRQGNRTRWPFEAANVGGIELGPDGRLAATYLEGGAYEIRILDPEGQTEERFAFGDGSFWGPKWHPDGRSMMFTTLHEGSFNVVSKTYGEPDLRALVSTKADEVANDWSGDGMLVVYEQYDDQGKLHLWATRADDSSQTIALTSGQANEDGGKVSPDGRWLAFESNRVGRNEVFVQRFPEADRVFKVSRSGGSSIRWSESGNTLYYRHGSELIEVRFREEGDQFVVENETVVLELPPFVGSYDVAPDGRFVVVTRTEEAATELKVIANWFAELERIAPTG